jgi:hypothetical protein
METQSVHIPTLKRGHDCRRNSRKVAANQDIGTRIVMEAQIESGAFESQNAGGPLSVTWMLAAIVAAKKLIQ